MKNLIQLCANDNFSPMSNFFIVSNKTLEKLEALKTLGEFLRFSIDLINDHKGEQETEEKDILNYLNQNVFITESIKTLN